MVRNMVNSFSLTIAFDFLRAVFNLTSRTFVQRFRIRPRHYKKFDARIFPYLIRLNLRDHAQYAR